MSHAISIGSHHPSLPGHFPGTPIVPGVVVLSHILTELRRQLPQLQVIGVKKLKFLHVIVPEQRFTVEFSPPSGQSLRFKCWRDQVPAGEAVIEGHLAVRVQEAAAPSSNREIAE